MYDIGFDPHHTPGKLDVSLPATTFNLVPEEIIEEVVVRVISLSSPTVIQAVLPEDGS